MQYSQVAYSASFSKHLRKVAREEGGVYRQEECNTDILYCMFTHTHHIVVEAHATMSSRFMY